VDRTEAAADVEGVPAGCVFCTLMRTGEAVWVAPEDEAVAFRPRPDGLLAPGHTLVVSRAHWVGVLDAPRAPSSRRRQRSRSGSGGR